MDAKALLDSLMGPSRDKAKKDQRSDEWKEKNICKRYLVGFCPNRPEDNWFHNTKRDVGLCNKIHSDALKENFVSHPERGKYEEEYTLEFLRFLESMTAEADAWISREQSNVTAPIKKPVLSEEQKAVVAKMQEDAEAALKLAEGCADKGDFNGSKQQVERNKQLQKEMEEFRDANSFVPKGDTVCDVCGVRFNLDDLKVLSYEGHLNSNLHTAYKRIREKAKELREEMRNRPSGERVRNRDEGDGRKDGSKDAGRDRDGRQEDEGRKEGSRRDGDRRGSDGRRDESGRKEDQDRRSRRDDGSRGGRERGRERERSRSKERRRR